MYQDLSEFETAFKQQLSARYYKLPEHYSLAVASAVGTGDSYGVGVGVGGMVNAAQSSQRYNASLSKALVQQLAMANKNLQVRCSCQTKRPTANAVAAADFDSFSFC